jgi:hypothetical protein
MTHTLGFTLVMALLLAGVGMTSSVTESVAQRVQDRSGTATDISAQSEQRTRGNAGQRGGGQQRSIQQRSIGQQRGIQQHSIGQQRSVTQQRSITRQRDIGQQRTITRQRDIARQPDISRQRDIGQRKFGKIRGASRATIAGRNYSIWRGSHRVHRHGRWRTFVGLSALSAVMFGSAYYYPYAYIDAPAPYCEGLTEDGCQLQWQAVFTLEGPTEFVCVAYCPWQ